MHVLKVQVRAMVYFITVQQGTSRYLSILLYLEVSNTWSYYIQFSLKTEFIKIRYYKVPRGTQQYNIAQYLNIE